MKHILFFKKIRKKDVPLVGGKTASLGELAAIGMPVPDGFAVTSTAYRYFIKKNKLKKEIRRTLKNANIHDIHELRAAGLAIRTLIRNASFPKDLEKKIFAAF